MIQFGRAIPMPERVPLQSELWPEALRQLAAFCRADAAVVFVRAAQTGQYRAVMSSAAGADMEISDLPCSASADYEGSTMQLRFELRRSVESGPFGEQDKARISELSAAVAQGMLLQHELRLLRARESVMRSVLVNLSAGIFIVDGECCLVEADAAALACLSGDGLVCLLRGRIQFRNPEDENYFRKLAAELAAGSSTSPVRTMLVSEPHREPVVLRVAAIPGAPAFDNSTRRNLVMVVLENTAKLTACDENVLQKLFNLTRAECRIANSLISGLSVREIAVLQGLSVHTVRTHLKRVLSKTGKRRQSELVALVGRLSRLDVSGEDLLHKRKTIPNLGDSKSRLQ